MYPPFSTVLPKSLHEDSFLAAASRRRWRRFRSRAKSRLATSAHSGQYFFSEPIVDLCMKVRPQRSQTASVSTTFNVFTTVRLPIFVTIVFVAISLFLLLSLFWLLQFDEMIISQKLHKENAPGIINSDDDLVAVYDGWSSFGRCSRDFS